MNNINLISIVIFLFGFISCSKENIENTTENETIISENSCVPEIEVPIGDSLFNRSTWRGEQSFGIATSMRDSLAWEASSRAIYDEEFGTTIYISTFFSELEKSRTYDFLIINFPITDECLDINDEDSSTRVSYLIRDKDVILDSYLLHSGTENFLEVIQVDTVEKVAEGKFMLTFLRTESDRLQEGPDTLHFHNGYFKCQIVE